MIKFKSLREAKVKASDYNATSEKSKFGGHRANIVHKTKKGDVLYTGKVSFKTPKAAKAAADSYLSGYAIGGEKGADKMMNAHIKNNKKNLVDTSVLDTMESVDEAATKVIASVELWNGKKMKKSFKNQSAAEAFIKKMQDEEDVRGYNMYAEGLDEAVELDEAFKRIPGNMINGELPRAAKDLESVLRGLKAGNDFDEKAFNKVLAALNNIKKSAKSFKSADDVTTPYQYRADPRYKRVNESVVLDENQVMSAQFKVGDMPNSDLFTSIEKLKTAKKKAEAQKPKVSDPVLVKSLNDVIGEIDKTIKDAEKVQATASKAIAKVAPSIKRTFELLSRKKYLVNSTEVEGNQLDEAFAIEKGAKVKMKAGSNKDLYGTVVKGVETKGFKVNGKQGIMVRWSNKVLGSFEVDQFAVALMDRKADYQIVDDGVRFDN